MKRIAGLKNKNLLALTMAAILIFTGCGSSAAKSENTESQSDDTEKKTYTIEVLSDADDETSALVSRGIQAAADKKLNTDKSELKIQFETGKTADKDLKEVVSDKPDLIITNGERSLTAAAKATTKIPIVASNVMNFQQIVGIEAAGTGTWDRLTGRNITGISSAPNVTAALSLLIEATPKLESVGILYTSYDSNAIFQNTRLEDYLDEAGIKWTEYEIPLPGQSASTAFNGTDAPSAAGSVSANGAEPQVSGNAAPSVSGNDAGASVSGNAIPQVSLTPEQIVAKAVKDNSVLFVSRNSLLSGQAQMIASAAENAGKGIIAGDKTFGQYALATLYSDPYQEGYTAGTMAASILADGKKVEKMKVRGIMIRNEHKLYNADYAKKLNMTFPKSFTEFNAYCQEQSASVSANKNGDED
jgi:ABC-type uncharacterized transport system substrate-binding protein